MPELEGLRGVAIGLVFAFHMDSVVMLGQRHLVGRFVPPGAAFVHAGHTGVSLFFVISGFLLSYPFLREAAGGKRVTRRHYYTRRALRILPLYWAAVVVATALTSTRPADSLHALPYLAFLRMSAGLGSPLWPYDAVWWSLATEVQFYLILPLLPSFLRTRRGRWIGSALLAAYGVTYVGFVTGRVHAQTLDGQIFLSHSLFGRAPLFVLGIAGAWFHQRYGDAVRSWCSRHALARHGASDVVLVLILLLLGLMLGAVLHVGYEVAESRWQAWHVLEGALWTAVLLLLLLAPLLTKPLWSSWLLQSVGILSYSIYIVHFPLLFLTFGVLRRRDAAALTGWSVPTAAVGAALAAVCVAISAATYWTIERPFLTRKAKIDP
jgi:peptidoglycan/LPS O-acetylase OafA/YrhL